MRRRSSLPNFLFIMADQFRFDYLGCAGADFVHTPNLDRLARRGMCFTHAFTPCPLCAPARIGLAAGLYPFRVGALDNAAFYPLSVPTYYRRLRDHGYHVGMVGKHDLAKQDYRRGRRGDRPVSYALGFTQPHETLGKMEAGFWDEPHCPYTHHLREKGLLERFHRDYARRAAKGWIAGASHDSVLPAADVHDAYIGQQAVTWIERVSGEFPWHYLASFVGPHDPFDPPVEYAERVREAAMPEPIASSPQGKPAWQVRRRLDIAAGEIAVTRRQYCASIALIDDYVGRMLDVLERRGLLEDTYVLFTSDHGEMLGDHHMYAKGVPYEAAVRVPLIVAGPGIEGGRVSSALVELGDLNPTLCQLAGLPPQENLDARSFCDVLWGVRDEHRHDVIGAIQNWRMIRTERLKYVENDNDLPELYDLTDPGEVYNVAQDNPGVVSDLRARLVERMQEGRWLR
jgi:arylsulfatase